MSVGQVQRLYTGHPVVDWVKRKSEQVGKLLNIKYYKYHNRNRHGERHTSESATCNRGGFYPDWSSHVYRSPGLVTPNLVTTSKCGRGIGEFLGVPSSLE